MNDLVFIRTRSRGGNRLLDKIKRDRLERWFFRFYVLKEVDESLMDPFSPIKIADGVDPFDPNNWVDDPDFVYRLQCNNSHVEALVDYEDYVHFSRWKWSSKVSKGGKKIYFCRASSLLEFGIKKGFSVYLHKVILERTGMVPASVEHTISDHRNGNSLDCRRKNLRWATPSMNRKNINGAYPYDLIEDQLWPTLEKQ